LGSDHAGAIRIEALAEVEVDNLGRVGHSEFFVDEKSLDGCAGGQQIGTKHR